MANFKDHADSVQNPNNDKYKAARDCFWKYCKLINPKFFRDDRTHLVTIANTLQALYEGRIRKICPKSSWQIFTPEEINELFSDSDKGKSGNKDYIICRQLMMNLPPRHGKSYTLTLFTQWMLGKNSENKVITVSYNDTLATRFSASVRDGIDATKLDNRWTIFTDVFPEVRIKEGDGAKQIWALEGSYFNYLGTGFGGTITGIGCNIGIIDDPIKNDEEAYNDNVLEKHWKWYTDTFLSRIEEDGIQIVNMTRWSTKDLCGQILESEDAPDWYELKMQACLDETAGIMLCPSLLSFKSYKKKKRLTSADIHEANYQQEPVDVQGKLYTTIKTYTELPRDKKGKLLFDRVINYTDTADTGKDFLCSINGVEHDGEAYITDILYSDKPMSITEPLLAKMLYKGAVNIAFIESNNGGSGFARNVKSILKKKFLTRKVIIRTFHQSKNKQSRILSNASFVMEHVYFPVNWNIRWPEFYKAIMTYKAKGRNKFDDAADGLTGLAESINADADIEFLR